MTASTKPRSVLCLANRAIRHLSCLPRGLDMNGKCDEASQGLGFLRGQTRLAPANRAHSTRRNEACKCGPGKREAKYKRNFMGVITHVAANKIRLANCHGGHEPDSIPTCPSHGGLWTAARRRK